MSDTLAPKNTPLVHTPLRPHIFSPPSLHRAPLFLHHQYHPLFSPLHSPIYIHSATQYTSHISSPLLSSTFHHSHHTMDSNRSSMVLLIVLLLTTIIYNTDAGSIGVNYGRIANNLPSAVNVVKLLKTNGITRVKLYDADPAVLRALAGSNISVTIDLPNELLPSAGRRRSFATAWVRDNVAAYYPETDIEAIAVGNEVFVDPHNTTKHLVPAMENLYDALVKKGLGSRIRISSPVALSALGASYPASAGAFREELVGPVFKPMLDFLHRTGSHLMVNAYPFFAYESNSDVISLDYALFRENPGVVDSGNGLRYLSLFDAQVDAVFAALARLGYHDMEIVVTETGWPSKGDQNEIGASVGNAAAYNGNLVRRILTGGGTPLRPQADLRVFLFALFNENRKFGPTSERNYGLFYPDETKVYDISFTVDGQRSNSNNNNNNNNRNNGGGVSKRTTVPVTEETWCVANVGAGREKLQAALDYACGEGGADCRRIQPGSPCYDPNTIEAHASYAFNSYYQKARRAMGSCDFEGAAYVVSQPPRFGKCEFPTVY